MPRSVNRMSGCNGGFVHFIVALPAEAKPLVSHYRLKRRPGDDAFAIFEKEGISLTVSGIGKAATANAIGYTQVLYGKRRNSVWLNIGVAGHHAAPLGSAWIGHKITDAETGRRWYPGICFRTHCPSAEIRTVAQPETEYALDCLYDMEASAFAESACRFSTGELVHCIKVISDNRESVIWDIDPSRVSAYVEGAIGIILHTKQALRHLAAELTPLPEVDTAPWTARWHFTAQQRLQLEKLLRRWRVSSGDRVLPDPPNLERSRQVLAWLDGLIAALPVHLPPAP